MDVRGDGPPRSRQVIGLIRCASTIARDRHIRHSYVETTFAAQGRTADRVLIHADSKATNLIDQRAFYVAVSRAREAATVVTNDRGKLVSAIKERAGNREVAMATSVGETSSHPKANAGMG